MSLNSTRILVVMAVAVLPLGSQEKASPSSEPFPAVVPLNKPADRPLSAAMERLYDVWNPHEDRGNELYSNFKFSRLEGFSYENNTSRRDPSKVLRISGKYYVWYTHRQTAGPPAGPRKATNTIPSFDWDLAEIWYATSEDGFHWEERGPAVKRAPKGAYGWRSVSTPDVLVWRGKYYLYYQGFNGIPGLEGDRAATTVAEADSPDGPWRRLGRVGIDFGAPGEWDSNAIHDPYPLVYRGKIYVFYKGSPGRQGRGGTLTRAQGVAIADHPLGPFTKSPLNPVLNSGHETCLWPWKDGIAAIVSLDGPEKNTVQYAADGVNFEMMSILQMPPIAPGPFVPDAFADNGDGRGFTWGLSHINPDGGGSSQRSVLARFDCDLSLDVDRPLFKRNNLRFNEQTYFQKRVKLSDEMRKVVDEEREKVDRDTITTAVGRPQRIKYNNPGLRVDLGVGLWAQPFPMDYDHDGDLDLVVLSGGKPDAGTYFFENRGCAGRPCRMPVFKAGVLVGGYQRNAQISYDRGGVRLLTPGVEYRSFQKKGFAERDPLPLSTTDVHPSEGRIRANQWRYADYDSDGDLDLVVGIGDWGDYGWDDAYNADGEWTNGPLHGFVYVARNDGSTDLPRYAKPEKVRAAGEPIDVYGMPSPSFADYDGDGDVDLICGEFLDGFTYFENTGSRRNPSYAKGRRLPVTMDLQMITPVAVDWDGDGDPDLVVGDEDGRVALVENAGREGGGMPRFLPPQYFQQEADEVKFGALVTPVGYDWDGDGDEDLVCGNTAGYIGFIENLDGGNPPKWAAPKYLRAAGRVIRIQAGKNGSIQGPAEAKWGYTTLNVADWDQDGRPDLVVNSIWGKVVWYRNNGTRQKPALAPAQPIRIDWGGPVKKPAWNWWDPTADEFTTQWRTTPLVADWNEDGLNDLIMLDHEGYLAVFERQRKDGRLTLKPGQRLIGVGASVFDSKHLAKNHSDGPLRLNAGRAGKSGRRKFCLADWDGDGRPDLLVNSVSVNFMRNLGEGRFQDLGPVTGTVLAGHTTSPTTVDWNGDGRRDLLIGAEDGHLYYLPNPYGAGAAQ